MDCSLSGSSVHGIFQARMLEWIAISFSRGSSRPRNRTWVSHIAGRRLTVWATRDTWKKCPSIHMACATSQDRSAGSQFKLEERENPKDFWWVEPVNGKKKSCHINGLTCIKCHWISSFLDIWFHFNNKNFDRFSFNSSGSDCIFPTRF